MAGYKNETGFCVMCGQLTKYTILGGQIECYVCHPVNDNPKCKADLTELVGDHGQPEFMKHLPFPQS